jgi:hypothetical protein
MFADAHEFPKSAQDVAAVVRGSRNVGTGLVQEFLFIVAAASSRALLIQNYIGIMDLPVPPSDSRGFDGTWLVPPPKRARGCGPSDRRYSKRFAPVMVSDSLTVDL